MSPRNLSSFDPHHSRIACDTSADGVPQACRSLVDVSSQVRPIAHSHARCVVREISSIGRVSRLLHAIATHDEGTYKHSILVAQLAASFAEYLGLGDEHIAQIIEAALLHDVGKLEVSASLLNKREPLSAEDLDTVHSHVLAGYKLLDAIGEYSEDVLRAVRHHHEKMDGSGYPDGLFGDDIPFLARFITICDIYAALIEHRAYRAPLPAKESLQVMREMQNKLAPEFFRQFQEFIQKVAKVEMLEAKSLC